MSMLACNHSCIPYIQDKKKCRSPGSHNTLQNVVVENQYFYKIGIKHLGSKMAADDQILSYRGNIQKQQYILPLPIVLLIVIDPSYISTICKECEFHIDKFISTLSTFVSFMNMTISRCPQKLFVIAEEQQSAMNGKMILL